MAEKEVGAEDPVLLGYVDPLSIAPGGTIRLMVSAASRCRIDVVRVIHGGTDPRGPGVRREEIATGLPAKDVGAQEVPAGSFLHAPVHAGLDVPAFTVTAWVRPTVSAEGRPRAIVARRDAAGKRGWALGIDGNDRLALWAGGSDDPVVVAAPPLPIGRWTFVAAALEPAGATLVQLPFPEWPVATWRAIAHADGPVDTGAAGLDVTVAAWTDPTARGGAAAHFNGRIDRPTVLAGAATAAAVMDATPDLPDLPALFRLRPGVHPEQPTVQDDGPFQLHAKAVNHPARAVPGCNWTGREVDFRLAPDEYDAIHFHDDDLTDAGWEPVLDWVVPGDLRSGVYAFRLSSGDEQLEIPFFVLPRESGPTARVAVLLSTFTYLAYANLPFGTTDRHDDFGRRMRWARNYRLLSLYDTHRDGTGCYYASSRRPLVTMAPDFVTERRGLWCLSADLCLIDWLEHEGVAYDVIADETLHDEGVELLGRYGVVMTGTHPEYYTSRMLDAHEEYLRRGGRVMYLGGNGFYWVTGVAPQAPHVIEIRRGHAGTRSWEGGPGETHLSVTGEPGGLWRHRGRAPQRHVGVGFTAQGPEGGRPYLISAAEGRGSFALAGLGGSIEVEGLDGGAPAGIEVDRLDDTLGSPPHVVVLATAAGFGNDYQHVVEEVLMSNSRQGGESEARVRADLAFFEGPNGGGVFSTGSIGWCSCLGVDGYENPVARVTGNVLRRFLDPTPLTG